MNWDIEIFLTFWTDYSNIDNTDKEFEINLFQNNGTLEKIWR